MISTKLWIFIVIFNAIYLLFIYSMTIDTSETGKLIKLTAPDGMECYVYKTGPPDCNKQKYNYDTGYGDATYSLPPLDWFEDLEGNL